MSETAPQGNVRCQINRKLLPVKTFYFFFLAAVGSLLPFIAIYMKSLGLTTREAGILYGVMPFIGFFIRPIIGAVADRWHRHKLILIIFSVLTGISYLLILTINPRVHPKIVVHSQLYCNVQDSYFQDCVSLSDKSVDRSTCDIGLSEFADLFNSSAGNSTDYDCHVRCTERHDSVGHKVGVCFTDLKEPFEKHCNGTLVTGKPLEFELLNISHVLNNEVMSSRVTIGNLHCRDYDLKSLQLKVKPYWQLLCDREGSFKCEIMCQNSPKELCQSKTHEFDSTFFWLFLVYLIANVSFSPVFSLADAAAFDTLGKKHYRFGEQRLWGTIGFAVLAIASTFIMYKMRKYGSIVDYTVPFYIFTVLCCLAGGCAFFMNLSSNIKCGKFCEDFLSLVCIPKVAVFLLVVLYFGVNVGVIEGFLFWYLTDLGASTVVFGLSLVINCLFEVPMLYISGKIIKRTGPVPCLYIALLALAVRLLGYSLLVNPWLVLLIEPLHGLTFGMMWAASSTNAAKIAPPGMSATIQGLVGGLHFGIGKGIGSLLTGFLFARLGERWSFRVYAIASVVLLACYAALNHWVFKSHMSTSSSTSTDVKCDQVQDNQQNERPLLTASNASSEQMIDGQTPLNVITSND